MTPFHYVVLAYGLIWIALALYLLYLGRRIGRLQGELEELGRRRTKDEG